MEITTPQRAPHARLLEIGLSSLCSSVPRTADLVVILLSLDITFTTFKNCDTFKNSSNMPIGRLDTNFILSSSLLPSLSILSLALVLIPVINSVAHPQ